MRRLLRTLPPIRWRDARIDALLAQRDAERARRQDLRRTLDSLEAELAAARAENEERAARETLPSFRRLHAQEVRISRMRVHDEHRPPRFDLVNKLRAQRIAQGHGVPVPTVYSVWYDVASIDLGLMPAEFVLKSAAGTGSHGVLPLRRTGDGFGLVSTDLVLSEAEVIGRLAAKVATGQAGGPFFAEEFLHGTTGDAILDDVKVYAFYGEVGHVLLRRVGTHGVHRSVTNRYVEADGTDLGAVSEERRVDPDIPVPALLDQIVDAARTLSVAARLPFVRVDLYETTDGVRFGEFTPRPGGTQRYVPEHDQRLGEL